MSDQPRAIPSEHTIAKSVAWRITIIYAIVGALWILFSDWGARKFADAFDTSIDGIQLLKGWFYIAATAALLYLLIRNGLRKIARAEEARREFEQRWRRLVELSPEGIMVHREGQILYVNPAAAELLRADGPGELVGKRIFDFLHPDYHADVRARAQTMRDQQQPVPLAERRMIRADGKEIWVEVAAGPLDYDGAPAIQAVIRDITARKTAEQELRRLNETLEQRVTERTAELRVANEDLQGFADTIAHDLRAPLRSLQSQAQSLLSELPPGASEKSQESVRRIVASSARMDRLIVELLEYNQIQRGQVSADRVSLVLLAHEVVGQLMRDPESRESDITIREPMPWVLAHRATLATVLTNLVSNAAKFVAPGVRPRIELLVEDRGKFARLWVVDNGIGIPIEHHEQIFQPFERLHAASEYPGTGLGLAIVRRGVERMGGRAGVESAPGAGSRFWIELPKDPHSP